MEGCKPEQIDKGCEDDKMKYKLNNEKDEQFTVNQRKMIQISRELDEAYRI